MVNGLMTLWVKDQKNVRRDKLLNSVNYCSKLLLFGEYSIIRESNALAIPYPLFGGELRFKTDGRGAAYPAGMAGYGEAAMGPRD